MAHRWALITHVYRQLSSYYIPNKDIAKLQRIQNSAAHLVSRLSKREHITPILKELHWLPVTHRIKYKVILMTFKAIYGTCPDYTCDLITPYIPSSSLRSSSQNLLSTKNTQTKTFGARMFSWAGSPLAQAEERISKRVLKNPIDMCYKGPAVGQRSARGRPVR